MDYRRLGATGFEVSPIGFGAFKIGRNQRAKYPHPFDLPDDRATDRLLNGVLDIGINLIDTAPAYGTSEERLGRALAHRRDEFILSTKVGETFVDGESRHDFGRAAVHASAQRSLRRLRTDVLDLVFVHSSGDDLAILQETDVVSALQELRDRGDARAIGFSGKTVAGAHAALAWADALMIEYHADDRTHEAVLGEAAAAGVGVVVKKPLASGMLDPVHAVRFGLAQRGVGSLIVGSLSLDHLKQNLRAAR